MGKFLSLLFVLCLPVLLSGCSYVEKGEVVKKGYSDPWVQMIPQKIGEVTSFIPVHHPGSYNITIKGKNNKGKTDTNTIEVSPIEYNEIEIGDIYTR